MDKYGNAFSNAYDSTLLFSDLVMMPVTDCELFFRFYSQAKKYHTLSIISTVRLHRIQAKMDMRYFLESAANAVFALAHPDTRNYLDLRRNGVAEAKSASTKAYAWLEEKYPGHSEWIKALKKDINDQTAHAHIMNSLHNYWFVSDYSTDVVTSFFDFEDDGLVKHDLWQAAMAGLRAAQLILDVRNDYGRFISSRRSDELAQMIADNDAVRLELRGKSPQ